jgi:beta-galactosidase
MMNLPGGDGTDQIGPFSQKAPGNGNSTGHVIGGTGWYRKSFVMDKKDAGKTVILKFDGVYMESRVWVNGKEAGIHKNGYTPFWFDITSLLNPAGKSNLIAVKVDNPGRNSRWYSGSGIYRDVNLIVTPPVHIAPWGVRITTPETGNDNAVAEVEVTTRNELRTEVKAVVRVNLKDRDGKIAASAKQDIFMPGASEKVIRIRLNILNPYLWSVESPGLYTAEVTVESGKKVADILDQSFGIRSIEFSAKQGFLLNGKAMKLKGGCLHHDNGLLGAAAYGRAEERKVEILKAGGFNAVRCAHNPPSEAFLDACDRLGILVIDEFSDMWEWYKNPQDYSRFFREWWKRDLTEMILRDRNHPAIIMWSIGNEIHEREDSTRIRISRQLADHVRSLDNTRAVTQAVTGVFYPDGWESTGPVFGEMDVCGYNYSPEKFEQDHQKYPERVMYTSESFPKDIYDYWKAVEDHSFVIGDFMWTSFDYLGEVMIGNSSLVPESRKSNPMGNFSGFKIPRGMNIFDRQAKMPSQWPFFTAWCGDFDITGEKKPQMLYKDVIWGNSKVEINVHSFIPEGFAENLSSWGWPDELSSWTWKGFEGKSLQVRVFTKASHVKLELNSNIVGEKDLSTSDKYIAVFEVPYQPGELKAITYEDGKESAVKVLKTAGEPVAIRLTPDRTLINADTRDLSFVTIELVDAAGQVVPVDSIMLNLSVTGSGRLAASGNANPGDMTSVNNTLVKTWKGRAQVVIRPSGTGTVIISAESPGIGKGQALIKVGAN